MKSALIIDSLCAHQSSCHSMRFILETAGWLVHSMPSIVISNSDDLKYGNYCSKVTSKIFDELFEMNEIRTVDFIVLGFIPDSEILLKIMDQLQNCPKASLVWIPSLVSRSQLRVEPQRIKLLKDTVYKTADYVIMDSQEAALFDINESNFPESLILITPPTDSDLEAPTLVAKDNVLKIQDIVNCSDNTFITRRRRCGLWLVCLISKNNHLIEAFNLYKEILESLNSLTTRNTKVLADLIEEKLC